LAMDNPEVMEFLERARPFPFQNSLGTKIFVADIATRARLAAQFPTITSESGQTIRGPGKASVPESYDAKVLCAAIVVDVWSFLHGERPSRTNKDAGHAASAFWQASGGSLRGWSPEQIGLWPAYFDQVDEPALDGIRKEICRQLPLYADPT